MNSEETIYEIIFNPNVPVLDDINHAIAVRKDIVEHNDYDKITLDMMNVTEITDEYIDNLFIDLYISHDFEYSSLEVNANNDITKKISKALIF